MTHSPSYVQAQRCGLSEMPSSLCTWHTLPLLTTGAEYRCYLFSTGMVAQRFQFLLEYEDFILASCSHKYIFLGYFQTICATNDRLLSPCCWAFVQAGRSKVLELEQTRGSAAAVAEQPGFSACQAQIALFFFISSVYILWAGKLFRGSLEVC